MGSSTNRINSEEKHCHSLFDVNCAVGDRILNPGLIECREGIIMPRELVTITKVTDYIIEVISDNFVPMKFSRM